jgi:hypothetical protein
MPNHVYNNISVEQEYADKLEAISKVGLAEFFKPRPKAYDDTQSPMPEKKDDPYLYELGKILEKHHGFTNWYEWSWANWGTKWGTYDNEFCETDHRYTYTTAWNPLNEDIIEMLAKYIPTFNYEWEEEQGYGAVYEYEDGERVYFKEFDIPNWEETDYEEIQYLAEDYDSPHNGIFRKGYYYHWSLHEYLGNNLKEAKKYLDSISN